MLCVVDYFDFVIIFCLVVILGDLWIGYMSFYYGFYFYLCLMVMFVLFVELDIMGIWYMDIYLFMIGDELWNIVLVDWVLEVICYLFN